MRVSEVPRLGLGVLTLALLSGCVSRSGARDAARVEDLTSFRPQTRMVDDEPEPSSHEDVKGLLKGPLTVERAVKIALLNNRDLRAQFREMGVARGQLIQAGTLPNPTVGAELVPEHESQMELSVEYDLTSALLAPLRARAAKPELEASRYKAAAAVVETGLSVKTAFYSLRAAEQRLELARTVADAFAAGLDAADALVDSGNAALIERASRLSAYERSRILVAETEIEVVMMREKLQRLLGLIGTDTEWTIGAEETEVPPELVLSEDLERDVVSANLDLVGSKHLLEGLARKSGVERTAGWLPDVSVDVRALRENPNLPAAEQTQEWRWGGGVSVGIPIFDRRSGATQALNARFDAEMERYIGRAIELRSMAREVKFRLESTHARVSHYRETLNPAQKELLHQMLLQVNAMQVGVFQLLQARRDQLEVELSFVEARRDYFIARAQMDALLRGGRIDTIGTRQTASLSSGSREEGH